MFQEKEIFLTELIMSGELLSVIMEELGFTEKDMDNSEDQNNGKILLGTVKDDVHDIGKNILKSLLITNGFQVRDIGVDVPIEKFLTEVKEYNPQVIAMSGLLTVAYDSMKDTIEAFEKAGLRDNIKIIIGGGATDQKVMEYTGADNFGATAVEGIEKIKKWIE
jgi:5-methyltetrahydrofolate--homocysteine methyltransferase